MWNQAGLKDDREGLLQGGAVCFGMMRFCGTEPWRIVVISIFSIIIVLACIVLLASFLMKRRGKSGHQPQMKNRTENDASMQDNTGGMQAACPFCGNKQRAENKFCIQCGQKMAVEQEEKYCPHCGIKLNGNMIFCKECGRKL